MTARDFQNEAKAKGHPWDNFLYIPHGWKMYERMNSNSNVCVQHVGRCKGNPQAPSLIIFSSSEKLNKSMQASFNLSLWKASAQTQTVTTCICGGRSQFHALCAEHI